MDELEHCKKVVMTPAGYSWNPYSSHFSSNEEAMLDFNGQMNYDTHRKRHCPGISEVTAIDASTYDEAVDSISTIVIAQSRYGVCIFREECSSSHNQQICTSETTTAASTTGNQIQRWSQGQKSPHC